MAEVLLAARLADHGVDAMVASAGTLGWAERGATPHAVSVMGEMGLDLSAHRSRKLAPDQLEVDLVLAMTRDHAGAVVARDKSLAPHVFLPGELVRLLRGSAQEGEAMAKRSMVDRIVAIGASRTGPTIGRPAEEVADPAGEPLDIYRATAARLDRDLTGLAALLGA
jgi:protein-tyrosine phosphatase